ncbi:hypothetical protein [Streptomyces ortus]|uniref:DUF4760 domain-containing protein n=1 Tax=Streptomyces ortus TaxID=2867268 RepID=A0ABT3UW00_9ACTN|nr:hypothetical protein [Streptomyces ortus]MCX4231731.1 hypothetical protein [Streptomyces ortus]
MNQTVVVISGTALLISLYSLYRSARNDRRDVSLKLHESLIDPKLQSGRKVLHEMQGGPGSLTPEQYELANRALAALDIAGFYCAKKYVREKDFLELWAPALVTLKRSAAPFLAHRDAQRPGAVPVWPYYRRLTERSEEYLRSRGVDIDN